MGRTKSIKVSTGVVLSTQPINGVLVANTGPIPVPEEVANCIVVYASMLSLLAGLRKWWWNNWAPPGITANPNSGVINSAIKTFCADPLKVVVTICPVVPSGITDNCLYELNI